MGTKEKSQSYGLVYIALDFLAKQFNHWYQTNISKTSGEPIIRLSPIVDQEGKLQIDKLGITLINIEEERIGKVQNPYMPQTANKADGYALVNPPIKLNLDILISAAFASSVEHYEEALKHISYVIQCFQNKNVFELAAHQEIAPIEKLVLSLLNKELSQLQSLWMVLGAKYVPSVMYRVKLLVINSELIAETRTPIKKYELSLSQSPS